ncbi:rhodanese-like domain-containing protein [Cupriavidus sp. YAF13]|uniref:rhodanese-like domain-containing protein n=1 Tax=Cupriavidus sp. YAF13 TaxID=3233075 RepID=UPI003F8FBF06
MTITDLSQTLADTDAKADPNADATAVAGHVSSARAAAVAAFIARAREIAGSHAADKTPLAAIADELVALASQAHLFPPAHFPVDAARPAAIYRLAEDPDGRFALFASAGLPGKAQPPHDHTTWAVIAGVRGVERNVIFHRSQGSKPGLDTLEPLRQLDVQAGNAITLSPTDVHTIELIGDTPGLHLHFYGLTLSRLSERVKFDPAPEGGTQYSYRTFAAPALIRHPLVSPAALKRAIAEGEELAVLDAREEGAFSREHLLFAVPAPLGRLETTIDRLVPRRTTRIVVTDLVEDIAHAVAAKLLRFGYTNVSVLEGGTRAWQAAGYEIFSGTNVPSKAFGEVIEHELQTPWITAEALKLHQTRGDNVVVVDSRPFTEFQNMSIPGAVDCPGAELVYRIGEIAPDPETLVVVNCAGRTRSIVGAQTLINAGIPNRVVSLKDGTMAWLLAGYQLDHGQTRFAPQPGEAAQAAARERATRVAQRAGVQHIDAAQLAAFAQQVDDRTLYRFDVRSPEEYAAGHLPGWRSAPGGQLVQATDAYAGTRRARIVLADWDGVRAQVTAAWLAQFSGHEVYLFRPAPLAPRESGPEPVRVLRASEAEAPWIEAASLSTLQARGGVTVVDVDSSLAFRRGHLPGAWFATPEKVALVLEHASADDIIVVTSSDGVLAQAVAAELRRTSQRDVRALLGGNARWQALGLPTESGEAGTAAAARVLTGDEDAWYSAYAYEDENRRKSEMHAYLNWEIGLVDQLERDGDLPVRLVDYRQQ